MILVISISIVGITRGTYMTYINTVRHEENEQVYQHLVAIRKIVAYKSMRNGADKAVAELLLNGIFQHMYKRCCYDRIGICFAGNQRKFKFT